MLANRQKHLDAIDAYIRSIAEANLETMSDEERAALVEKGVQTYDALVADAKMPKRRRNMRDIVDANAGRVDTGHIGLPNATHSTFENDIATVRKLVEAGRANREAALTAASVVIKGLIGVAALAI